MLTFLIVEAESLETHNNCFVFIRMVKMEMASLYCFSYILDNCT